MRLHHLALRAADLPALARFYVDVLGLPVVRRMEARSIWLDAGGCIVMLEQREEGEPAPDAGSKELVAFAIDKGARASILERLTRAGVTVEASTEFTLYVRDPEGRRVGLSSYPEPLT